MREPSSFSAICRPLLSLMLATAGCSQAGAPRVEPAAEPPSTTSGQAVSPTLARDWRTAAPGVRYHIRPSDLPAATMAGNDPEASVAKPATVVPPPAGAMPRLPDGFTARVLATGLKAPRNMQVAPNGDVFIAEFGAGRVLVVPAASLGGATVQPQVFAERLERPYGIAFVPREDPQWVYVAAANQVVRYPYRAGATRAGAAPEVIVRDIPTKRHSTRALVASRDGRRLFVAVGSASNLGGYGMGRMPMDALRKFEETHGRGAAWGEEENRGVVRVFDADGTNLRNYTTGLRNCSGMTLQPGTDNLWCVVNERDHLGPNMVPDFMVRLQDGAFHGWPWYTIGDREDPARRGERPDLRGQVRTPEVLFQAHSSALSVAFYDGDAFPSGYRGDAFAALHGSHSRPGRTGYKVVRVLMRDGAPTGEYEDFMTGFVLDGDRVWGRPAGVAVTRDGALLVSDDGNGIIYSVTHR